jgi:hypothetical protein
LAFSTVASVLYVCINNAENNLLSLTQNKIRKNEDGTRPGENAGATKIYPPFFPSDHGQADNKQSLQRAGHATSNYEFDEKEALIKNNFTGTQQSTYITRLPAGTIQLPNAELGKFASVEQDIRSNTATSGTIDLSSFIVYLWNLN